MTLGLLSVALLVLIVVAVVILVKSCSGPAEVDLETGRFLSGVYINGMDLSGKTVDEVRAQLETNETYALSNINITLASEEINATISGADMNASSNLNAVIEQALSGGPNQVYYTTISIDETALTNRINAINQTSSKPPVEPAVVLDFTQSGPTYTEGQGALAGCAIHDCIGEDRDRIGAVANQLSPCDDRSANTDVEEVKAHTAEIGRFTTTYSFKGTAETRKGARLLDSEPCLQHRKRRCMINGQVVQPGETWSFNKTLRPHEKNAGRKPTVFLAGDTLTEQLAAVFANVSTTLFNAL
jgi:hypothetical protein